MRIKRSTLHSFVSHPAFEGEDCRTDAAYIIVLDSILQELFRLKFDQKYKYDDKVQDLLSQLRTLVVTEEPVSMVLNRFKRVHIDQTES